MPRALYLAGWGWVLIAAVLVYRAHRPDLYPPGEPLISLSDLSPASDATIEAVSRLVRVGAP